MFTELMASGSGGGSDISDIIDVQTTTIAQSSRRNAIYTVGISNILVRTTSSDYTTSLYDSPSGGNIIANIASTDVLVDVSNYNVVYLVSSLAAVVVYVTVKS